MNRMSILEEWEKKLLNRKTVSGIMLALFLISMFSINLVRITVAQTRDVAVVEVTPYPTKVGLGLNESVDITVVVENQGTENENFTVTVSYDSTFIETQNVTDLASGTNTTLNFAWDTSGLAVGTYSINATASFVPGETDTADNTAISTVDVVSPYMAVLSRRTIDTTLTPGQNYTISIYTNYDGSDIWGYDFTLIYNPLVLEGVEVVNGDLITEGDVEFFAGDFNNTEGRLEQTTAVSLNKSAFPYTRLNNTGPGILANVTFTIVGEGESPITIVRGAFGTTSKLKLTNGTNIIDYVTDVNPLPTEGKFLDGFFQNKEVVHDMAVIDMVFSPNNVTVGEFVSINVTIKNKGTELEEVIVTVYWGFADGVPLHPIGESETVTIGSGESKILAFEWNTTEVTEGTHPLTTVVDYNFVGIEDANPDDNMLKKDNAVTVKARDTTPPTISIASPENKTYTTSSVSLNFTVDEATSWIGYSLDGQANVTITGNTTLTGLSDGSHSLMVYAKDTAGNTGASEIIYFTIETEKEEEEVPFWMQWWFWAIVVLVVIALAGVAYFLKKRKQPTASTPPSEGTETSVD